MAGRERDRRGQRGAVEGGVEVYVGAWLELDVAEPPYDLVDRDAQVHTGQVGADATVGPCAEGDVTVPRAVKVEDVRLGELGFVAVGRRPEHDDSFTLFDVVGRDRGVVTGGPADADERTIEAQQLLNGPRDQLRPGAQQCGNLRVLAKPQHRRAQYPGGGLQAAENQQLDGADGLLTGDGPTFDLGVHHRVDHVTPGPLFAPLLDEPTDPLGELQQALPRFRQVRERRHRCGVIDFPEIIYGRVERQAERREPGKRPGEVPHEVALAALDERVDEVVHQLAGGFGPRSDLRRGEVDVDLAPEPALLRRCAWGRHEVYPRRRRGGRAGPTGRGSTS